MIGPSNNSDLPERPVGKPKLENKTHLQDHLHVMIIHFGKVELLQVVGDLRPRYNLCKPIDKSPVRQTKSSMKKIQPVVVS